MDITPLVKAGQKIIQSYNKDGFTISGTRYEGAVFVAPESVDSWDAGVFETLDEESFQFLIGQAADIDVVLLGVGAKMQFLPVALRQTLKAHGLKVEVMDTSAACRTYNVLITDGRRVVAALLPFK